MRRDARAMHRWAVPLLLAMTLLVACGGSATVAPTVPPTPSGPRPTPTPPPTIDPIHVRTGSAIIPSPTGEIPSSVGNPQSSAPSGAPPPGIIPPTVPIPTVTTGKVLPPLPNGQAFTTADKKATVRYPNDWAAQTQGNAAQFVPRGASPTDPNTPIVTFNGIAVQLDLLKSDNAQNYAQTLASQTLGRGGSNVQIRSVDQVRLGSPTGPEAVRIIASYTIIVDVISEQVVVQPPNSDQTYFISATTPAGDFASKWSSVIDGIAGSVTFP